jgi:hypothetical protein
MPTTRKVSSATLINAADNLISPNHLTESLLMVNTMTSDERHQPLRYGFEGWWQNCM